ncbi:type I DNA topoisomerase [soil metagenome]
MQLVIVESPTKAKTIGKFLGKDYEIKFSMGHVMDLPKSKLGVDTKDNFKPQLEVVPGKEKVIAELRKLAKSATQIILATDPDREGEAISANIKELLEGTGKTKLYQGKFKRVVFHEITEEAIKEAFLASRDVDENLVNAQVARRILDRLVGYKMSPLLWKKVRRGLSAGRVQSVALRLIVEREREIEKFAKENYFTVHALLQKAAKETKAGVEFELIEIDQKKIEVQNKFALYDGEYKISKTTITEQQQVDQVLADIKTKQLVVADVIEKESKRSPQPPFTTSTLQQDASRRFGFPGKRTMSLAQKLYEEGYITYHRTDSVTLSPVAVKAIREYVTKAYGEKYVPVTNRQFAGKQKLAQEAHEAIRPTKVAVLGKTVEQDLGKEYAKLYDLIWRRSVASQMSDALIQSTSVLVDSPKTESGHMYRFKTNGSVLVFEGFLKINPQALTDTKLPQYTAGENLDTKDVRAELHETPPPPRYNDASLIGALEEKGIGRPSTYASIISTIVDRTYVERLERRFAPTSIGAAVNDFLVTNFSSIDDIPFTAQMEDDLDEVANGKKEWEKMMKEFYTPFEKKLIEVEGADRIKIAVEDTGVLCPECKEGNLVVRTGKFGKFISCARFPECKFTKPLVKETDMLCPTDGGKIIIKKTRKGRNFFGCENYPTCTFAAWKMEDIKKA